MMRRREFITQGARLAAAGAVGGWLSLDSIRAEASSTGSLRKCISLGGPGSLRQDGHPDDYLLWGNREYIRDLSGTTWVKLWVSWYDLQQELGVAPANRAASWSHLNGAPGGLGWLARLDRQLRAVNDDGLGAILALNHTFPTWSNGASGPDPSGSGKPSEQRIPADLSVDGPWGWFISYLISRYRKGGGANPLGATIDALEICNEPNYLAWPQEGIAAASAQMIQTSTLLSATWGPTPILAPATSDFPDRTTARNGLITGTVWSEFTQGVLTALSGFRSPVPLRWSHHNYRDVRLGEAPSRAERVLGLLAGSGWRSDGPPLWLTEGGLNLASHVSEPAQRQSQARSIERNFRRMMRLSDVYMWTQHTISDKQGNSFKSGLRDDFVWGAGKGGPRPSWFTWRELPGAEWI